MKIRAVVNGAAVEKEIDGSKRLIDFLREDLGLTGTKEGCSEGECGACTVILNGEAVPSCLVLAGQIQGGEILTIEGLEKNGELDLLQKKFISHGAIQCGFCTPGFLMSAKALFMKILILHRKKSAGPLKGISAAALAISKSSKPSKMQQRRWNDVYCSC